MAKSKDLYELVHSLKTGEKNFILSLMEYKGSKSNKRYYKHFIEISKMKTYNEIVWKGKLSFGKSLKSMVWTNSYLYKYILKALNMLRDEIDDRGFVLSEMQKIDILIERGLYHQAHRLILSTKEFARKQQLFELCLDVINAESYVLQLIGKKLITSYDQIELEWQELNNCSINLRKYRKLEDQANRLYKKYNTIRNKQIEDEYLAFNELPLLKDYSQATTLRSQHIFLRSKLVINSFLGNKEAAKKYSKLCLQWLREHGTTLKNPLYSCSLLVRELELVILHERWDDYEEPMQMYLEMEPRLIKEPHYTYWYVNKVLFNIQFAYYSGDTSDALKAIEEIDQKAFKMAFESHASIANLIAYTAAKIYRKIGDHKQSLNYLDMILNNEKLTRRDMYVATRLLILINHYESGDIIYLPYAIKSFYRLLRKMEHLYNGERSLIKFFGKVIQLPINSDISLQLSKLLADLKQFKEDKFESGFFYYFDYISWIENQVKAKAA